GIHLEAQHYSEGMEIGMAALSVAIALSGIFLAYTMYCKKSAVPERISKQFNGLYTTLVHKYYIDELYDALFVNRAKDAGRSLWRFDSKVVDGAVNDTAF